MFMSLNLGMLSLTLPLDEAVRLAQETGFTALDLPIGDLLDMASQTSMDGVINHFRSSGIRPGAWNLPVDFRGADDVYQRGLAELPRHAALAQALGSPWCITWIAPFSDTLEFGVNMERHVSRLRPIAQILADHNCRLGLEFVGPSTLRVGHTYSFISTIEDAFSLAKRLDTGNVGLVIDSFHWYTSHASVADLLRLSAHDVVAVHLNDAPAGRAIDEQLDKQRLLPGKSGVIAIVDYLHALKQIGVEGPVEVEPFDAQLNTLSPAERVRATAASLALVWKQAGLDA